MNIREITICYGMTETAPVSTQTRVDDAVDKRVNTVGAGAPRTSRSASSTPRAGGSRRAAGGASCARAATA